MSDAGDALADTKAEILSVGEDVIVRRYAGTGAARAVAASATVKARVTGYEPAELVGAIKQGDRKVIALAGELAALLPLRTTDRIEIGGVECSVEYVDDRKRRISGVLIALEIAARG